MLLIDGDIILFRILWACKDHNFYYQVRANDWVLDRVLDDFGNPDFFIALSGSNNFRKQLDPTYKSNRTVRPNNLHEMRQYYIKYWGAKVAVGEADDLLASLHTDETILVSSDKDFKQLGGKLYNPWKNELIEVDNPEYWFWFQTLTGDSADVVKTLPGIGPKKAEKLLAGKTNEEMKATVFETYQNYYGEDWFSKLDLTARLLWLKRSPESQYYDILSNKL
jgi:5'-3' exonuclease